MSSEKIYMETDLAIRVGVLEKLVEKLLGGMATSVIAEKVADRALLTAHEALSLIQNLSPAGHTIPGDPFEEPLGLTPTGSTSDTKIDMRTLRRFSGLAEPVKAPVKTDEEMDDEIEEEQGVAY